MPKRTFVNRLNNLDPKTWLKFQKSWFVHNPPPRRKDVLRHPAKFPETLAQDFIEFFTKPGQVVFDPMAGTGSTLLAALRAGRHSYGIELNPAYSEIARSILDEERRAQDTEKQDLHAQVITGDAAQMPEIISVHNIPAIDYVLTSPPYWNMLHAHGFESQKTRRSSAELDLVYSTNPNDLGNLPDYEVFLEKLVSIYEGMQPFLRASAYITIIVKNIKKGGKMYPLAWDLARQVGKVYTLKDEKIWCQDNQRLAPYGLGNVWVSNTFHHYCLQFRNE
jgi:DNA modification methylase